MLTNRKRGSPKSVLVVIIFGFGIFLSSLFGHYLLSEIQANASGLFQYGIISQGANVLTTVGNGGTAFIMFSLFGVIMFRATQISLHPIFIVPGIVIVGGIGYVLAQFGNMFWMLINASSGLSASAQNFPLMLSFNQNLVTIGMAISGLVILIMIGRWR